MQKLVVLTGAGISAESGLKTFRDSGGLWEGHDVMEVASSEGWAADPELILDFYNQRRKQAINAKPNAAHIALAELEEDYEVTIITQNVDNLHEQAGSSNVIHLHGELSKVRSTIDESLIYELKGWELNLGDRCEKGSQLRPHIVWFGEPVPLMEEAIALANMADFFLVVGTSLTVYPAAGLINFVSPHIPKFIIDPKAPDNSYDKNMTIIKKTATQGMEEIHSLLSR